MCVSTKSTKQERYQAVLHSVYGGTVTAVERYINTKAIILHHCSQCCKDFYARPSWLIGKPSLHHKCYTRYGYGDFPNAKERTCCS